MERLFRYGQDTFHGKSQPVAVVMCPSSFGTHLGLLHLDEKDQPAILHLAFHYALKRDAPGKWPWQVFVWAVPDMEPERADSVAALARLIWKHHTNDGTKEDFKYALQYVDALFDLESGELLLDEEGIGLTCSTFVHAIFKSERWPLVEQDTWKARPGDVTWQAQILGALAEHASEAHLLHIAGEMVGQVVRIRPQDVLAGAIELDPPIDFERASVVGPQAVQVLINPQTTTAR